MNLIVTQQQHLASTIKDFEDIIKHFNKNMYVSEERTPDDQGLNVGCEMLIRLAHYDKMCAHKKVERQSEPKQY